jgi:hypothetical protein
MLDSIIRETTYPTDLVSKFQSHSIFVARHGLSEPTTPMIKPATNNHSLSKIRNKMMAKSTNANTASIAFAFFITLK